MALSEGLSTQLLDFITSKHLYTTPQRTYIGLLDANMDELHGKGYARSLIGSTHETIGHVMGDPLNGEITNRSSIFFDEATDDWSTAAYFALYDDNSLDTEPRLTGPLTTPITVESGQVAIFKPGNFTISIT